MAMTMRYLLTLACAAVCLGSAAQKEVTVIDMETHTPLAGVTVTLGTALTSQLRTDYTGGILIPDHADSITLGHTGYETRHLTRAELTDTLELMRKYNALGEVVIYGKLPQVGIDFGKMLSAFHEQQRLTPRPKPLATFDFFSIFSSKKRKRTQERIKAIENY